MTDFPAPSPTPADTTPADFDAPAPNQPAPLYSKPETFLHSTKTI